MWKEKVGIKDHVLEVGIVTNLGRGLPKSTEEVAQDPDQMIGIKNQVADVLEADQCRWRTSKTLAGGKMTCILRTQHQEVDTD